MNEQFEKVLSELQEQNKKYTDAYWAIYDNKEAVPADQQACMRAELLKNYSRTVALLDGQEGLNKEHEITELEIKRLQINEEARLRKAGLSEEYRLKHVELSERADTEAARLKKEFEIKRLAVEKTLEVKAEQIIPIKEELPRRWWQKLFRRPARYFTNYAYELASRKADIEAAKYFAMREDEIAKLEAEQSGTDELEVAVTKIITDYTDGMRRRKAKTLNKALSELVRPLCEMFARRERALSEITECAAQPQNEQASESEDDSDELQNRAVMLLSEFCKKRIDELQRSQIKPPKRQRKRKARQEGSG